VNASKFHNRGKRVAHERVLTELADRLTFDRLRDMGVTVCGIKQAQTELVSNFGTPDGQKAMKINMEEIISRLAK
jgi:hypothetical protein